MSDGSVTVIELKNDQVLGSIEILKAAGCKPNRIMPLPNHFRKAGCGRTCTHAGESS